MLILALALSIWVDIRLVLFYFILMVIISGRYRVLFLLIVIS